MTLMLILCAQDLTLARLLMQRIAALGAWRHFSALSLTLDQDLNEEEARLFLGPELAACGLRAHFRRDPIVDRWSTDRGGMALEAYRAAISLGREVLRLDLDLYPRRAEFFEVLLPTQPGFAGRRMDFFLPSMVKGRQLCYIQGGVTRVGPKAAAFIQALSLDDYRRRKLQPELFWEQPLEQLTEEHRGYFALVEDLCLSGVEAQLAGIERHDIPDLQRSPYEILPRLKSPPGGARALWEAFERTGALAYHYEGSQAGLHAQMSKYLKWAYHARPAPSSDSPGLRPFST